uniref:Uncharacterized protein n=1 Tax=Paenarthrobacter nicotinovorans TaxID=29320 RepID=Q8GAF2_PAENI|nr:hypothetical protein [Paenarthrobacter nicotinovorans]
MTEGPRTRDYSRDSYRVRSQFGSTSSLSILTSSSLSFVHHFLMRNTAVMSPSMPTFAMMPSDPLGIDGRLHPPMCLAATIRWPSFTGTSLKDF